MSETTLSKRARKKQARAQGGSLSESVASDARKDNPSTASSTAELDAETKLREGINPFIDVVQKKVRNLTKRRVIFHKLIQKAYC